MALHVETGFAHVNCDDEKAGDDMGRVADEVDRLLSVPLPDFLWRALQTVVQVAQRPNKHS